MERKHPQNIRTHSTTHKHRPAHTHMLKLSPETVREQKRNGDVREKEGGNKDIWKSQREKVNESEKRDGRSSFFFFLLKFGYRWKDGCDLEMPLLAITVSAMKHCSAL